MMSTKMKITKRQLRRIIKEEKAKVLAEQKVRRIVRRRLTEGSAEPHGPPRFRRGSGAHTVTGNHEGQEFSIPVPDDLVRRLLDAHAALLAISSNPNDVSHADSGTPQARAFGDAATQVFNYVDDAVEKQTGKPVHPSYGINGEYHQDGSQMSDVLNDAGNFL